jgi:hypothetical protein
MTLLRIAALALVAALISGSQALAVTGEGPNFTADYVCAMQSTFGMQGPPFSGDLKLTVKAGIVTGTYTATSARPDPYYGRIIQVTGGVSGKGINLRFGNISLPNGELEKDGTIKGTAHWSGKLYNFLAKPRPHPSPKPSGH